MWEEELLVSLKEDLDGVVWFQEEDEWWWNVEDNGMFSVKSAYDKLERLVLGEGVWNLAERRVFEDLWKIPAPSKVVAFAWKVFLNRIPTKVNLAVRNVVAPDGSLSCVLCDRGVEFSIHLFLHCELAAAVWFNLMKWVDGFFLIPPNLFIHWECWGDFERNKNIKMGRRLIWLATVWVLWKIRNDKIFNGVTYDVHDIVEEIKVLSWKWLLSRTKTTFCLFYEWCWDPISCLRRRIMR